MKKLTFVFTALFALSLVSCQDLQDAFKVFNFSSFGVPITSLTVPSEGLPVGFDLDSQLPWQVLSQPDWIGISPADGGRGRVTITVTPHDETDTPRSGVITFRASDGSKIDLPVSQYPITLSITDIKSPNQESLSADALSTALDLTKGLTYIGELEPYTFAITSNTAWTVTCPSWSEIDATASTIATGSFTLANNAITGGNGNATLVVRPKKNGLSDPLAAGFDPNTPITKTGSETANQLTLTYQKGGSAQTVQVSLNVRMPIAMVFVQGGSFNMEGYSAADGADYTWSYPDNWVHSRAVAVNSFYMSKYELTQGQWAAVMNNAHPSYFTDSRDGVTDDKSSQRPVEQVSWNAITTATTGFLAMLHANSIYQVTGNSYRLPSSLEWEYAARGGMYRPSATGGTDFPYSGSDDIEAVAWYYSTLNNLHQTHPVGKKQENALGLYDMSGNVWEWCQDTYSAGCVIRGGSWYYFAASCRVSFWNFNAPDDSLNYLGFRLCF